MSKIKFGFADRIITPSHPEYFYLDGYGFRMRPAEGVRDDLHAKVCAISDESKTFLLFSLDLIGLRPDTYNIISDQISQITGIKRECIALCCTHTHAAPATGLLNENPINFDYFAYVGEVCALAAQDAVKRATPCSVNFSILDEELLSAYNRREGRDVIDRRIRAATFHDGDGTLRGVFCTAACHAVVNTGYKISSDWLSVLNDLSSDEVPYMFFQGRCADIDPMLYLKLPIDELISRLGTELSVPVENFAKASTRGTPLDTDLLVKYEIVKIPRKHLTDIPALKEKANAAMKSYCEHPSISKERHYALRELQWLRHMLHIAESDGDFDSYVPMQYLALGKECIFAFVPFEMLTLTGNKLEEIFVEKGYPREGIFLCGYSNVTDGYLAPEEEFEFGGYEVYESSHWYKISETVPESESTVIDWFKKKVL